MKSIVPSGNKTTKSGQKIHFKTKEYATAAEATPKANSKKLRISVILRFMASLPFPFEQTPISLIVFFRHFSIDFVAQN